MTVKEMLEICSVYDQWEVYQKVDEDTFEKIGYLFYSEMEYYNDWKVDCLRPEGDVFCIEIIEPKGE